MYEKTIDSSPGLGWLCSREGARIAVPLCLAILALVIGVSLAGTPIVGYAALGASVLALLVVILLHDPFWGLAAYMVTFYVRPGELVPALAPLHIERVVGLLALAVLIWHRRTGERWESLNHRVTLMMAGFLGIMALSVVTAYWKTLAILETIEFAKILVAYLLIIGLVNSERRMRAFVWIYLVLIGWTAGSSLWGFFSGANRGFAMGIDRARGLALAWGHPNSLAMTLLAAVPFLYLLIPVERRRPARLVLILIFALSLLTIMYTGSRAGMLGVLVAAVALWWRTGRRPAMFVGIAVALLCAALLMPYQYQMRMVSILDYQQDPSSLGRIDSWISGLHMFLDRPLLGVGPGNFGIAHGLAYSSPWRPSWLEAHSIYIQLPAELGLVGLVWFAGILFVVARVNRKTRQMLVAGGNVWSWHYRLAVALDISLVVLLFTGLFGHNLYRPTYYFIAGMSVALAYIVRQVAAGGPASAQNSAQGMSNKRWEVT
jgi:putative inorganic carbon (HCO3(-)) transporter